MKNTIITTLVAGSIALTPFATFAQTDPTAMMKKNAMIENEVMLKKDAMIDKDAMMKKDNAKMKKSMTMKEKMIAKKDAIMKKKKAAMEKDRAMMKKDTMTNNDSMMSKVAGYVLLKKATSTDIKSAIMVGKKNVVFFHAPWCPTCKTADVEIMKEGVKEGYNIIRVDYDQSTDLKAKYGVTSQHTFVQVDDMGELKMKWTGGDLMNIYNKAQ